MSAQLIYDHAPLGAIIRYSDGMPRPPERHRRKLQAWENRNNTGRLVKKMPGRRTGELVHVAESRPAAEDWLSRHGYPDAVLHEVTADEVAADHVEGRAA